MTSGQQQRRITQRRNIIQRTHCYVSSSREGKVCPYTCSPFRSVDPTDKSTGRTLFFPTFPKAHRPIAPVLSCLIFTFLTDVHFFQTKTAQLVVETGYLRFASRRCKTPSALRLTELGLNESRWISNSQESLELRCNRSSSL